jgi:hypothetical protein
MTAPVSQVLSEAGDLLEKPGAWGQGDWEADGCFCIDGALMHVKGDYDTYNELEVLREAIGCEGVIWWNDAEGRTQEEVVDALRRAAALAKEQGR